MNDSLFCSETLEFCVSCRGLLVLLLGFDLITDCKIWVLIVFVFGGGGFWKSGHRWGFVGFLVLMICFVFLRTVCYMSVCLFVYLLLFLFIWILVFIDDFTCRRMRWLR